MTVRELFVNIAVFCHKGNGEGGDVRKLLSQANQAIRVIYRAA